MKYEVVYTRAYDVGLLIEVDEENIPQRVLARKSSCSEREREYGGAWTVNWIKTGVFLTKDEWHKISCNRDNSQILKYLGVKMKNNNMVIKNNKCDQSSDETDAYGTDIISILEEKVIKLAKEHWKSDKCPPEFWVSLNDEDVNNHRIMLTISHLGYKFTEKIFPRDNSNYGYDSLLNQMINMYNKTM